MKTSSRVITLSQPASWEAERYRSLRRTVERLYDASRRSVIGVASAETGEGKTTTSINLAAVHAEVTGSDVLLMDCDFRCGTISQQLEVGDGPTLSDAIDDEKLVLADVVVPASPKGLPFSVTRSRANPVSAHRLVESPRFGQLMAAARRQYDVIIMDTPPLLWVADCKALSHWIDGFLVVVAAGQTKKDRLSDAIGYLEPGKLLGLVFNRDVAPAWGHASRYYHAYGPQR